MKKNPVLTLIIVVITQIAMAQPGTLDVSFGDGGKVIGEQFGNCYDMGIQKDGRIVLAGSGASFKGFLTARYLPDGRLDSSFGENGKVITEFANASDASMVIQKDGKILVAGTTYKSIVNYDIFMVRYTANGSPDSRFGMNGIVDADFGLSEFSHKIAVQDDGKIISVGTVLDYVNGGYVGLLTVRYLPDGKIDSSFGSNGKVITNPNGQPTGTSIAIQQDGKLVVGAYGEKAILNGTRIFILLRYTEKGVLDASFGINGIIKTDFETKGDDNLNDLTIQLDGKIVAAGNTGKIGNNVKSFCMARYETDGSLDTTFGTGGKVITVFAGRNSIANTLSILPGNKIILAGPADLLGETTDDFAMSCYKQDGSLDSSFGENGQVVTDIGLSDWIWSTVIQEDGKILAAGQSFLYSPEPHNNYALVRYIGFPINQHPTYAQIKRWIRKHILNFEDTNPNAAYYVIEKSTTAAGAFMPVIKINATAVNSTYSYPLAANIQAAGATDYFRIKTVNKDNSVTYTDAITDNASATQQINKSTNQQIHIYPNPAKDKINIESADAVKVRLQNSNGMVLLTQTINGKGSMDISKLPSGIYYVVNADSGESFKLVKE